MCTGEWVYNHLMQAILNRTVSRKKNNDLSAHWHCWLGDREGLRRQKSSSSKARGFYTVNHKKRDILFLTITLANLTNFYSFYIILIVKKFYMRL